MARAALPALACACLGAACAPHPAPPPAAQPVATEAAERAARQALAARLDRERIALGLAPLRWDERAARAAQRGAEDRASHGSAGPIGSDGSLPEQRHSEAGATGLVVEVASCFVDGASRPLDLARSTSVDDVERAARRFLSPEPSGAGAAVLGPRVTGVGVGLAHRAGDAEPCVVVALVTEAVELDELPLRAAVGEHVVIGGRLRGGDVFGAITLARVDVRPPGAAPGGAHVVPVPFAAFFERGYRTPTPVEVADDRFQLDVALSDDARPGLYEVGVWTRPVDGRPLELVSLRTILVGP